MRRGGDFVYLRSRSISRRASTCARAWRPCPTRATLVVDEFGPFGHVWRVVPARRAAWHNYAATRGAAAVRALRVFGTDRKLCHDVILGHAFLLVLSQLWQDWMIFHNIFPDRLKWGDGQYVDVGTNMPTVISNTLFFDKCLGWRGVCFEPQAQYHEEINKTRGCTLIPACVLGSNRSKASFQHSRQSGRQRQSSSDR